MRLANLSLGSALKAAGIRALAIAAMLLGATAPANAGGPRWVSGAPYFSSWGVLISWYTNQPQYFTDPGDLSPSVNHAAADAIVAHAAAIWNIPTASLVLTQGGTLSEHISGANVYAGANGLVFPADVQISNFSSKQIAVIYDTDGSVTDMLLGSGASDPSGCLQSGVTESVDSMTPQGRIQHAILVLNGRCTGPQPEKQLQLQYQLERAFGRILGLGWSQTNDNVFTGSPTPTSTQALNWPIMHPIDITCGPYTYQCLPQPFTLRPDDISALEQLYFIQPGQAGPGKAPSWSNAGGAYGYVTFPNGQGMEGVNVVVRRRAPFWDTAEDWDMASSVTGYAFRGQSTTSITDPGSSPSASMGVHWQSWEGYYRIQSIPVPPSQSWTDLIISTEPVNPLYAGPYAIGPQAGSTMSPSGVTDPQVSQYLANGRDQLVNFTPTGSSPTCTSQTDGTEGAPAAVAPQGWWTGTLCGYQHQAWSTLAVKANRSLTLEVTALNEQGLVTVTKAMPVIGVWKSTDPTGTRPTVASAATAFNSLSVGVTTIAVQSSTATSFRIAVADQRGAGRPDFAYQARVLYADTISPATVSSAGGSITISGMGFRQGNSVFVNGVPASVTSWTPNAIVATVPSLHDMGLSRAIVATVTVQDVSTGATSEMTGALTYASPVEALQLISAPSGTLPSGTPAATVFSVKAIAPDGFTPIVGESVSFSAQGAATLSPCAALICTVLTNAAGVASASVTPNAPGAVALTATGRSGSVVTSFIAVAGSDALHLLSAPAAIMTSGLLSTTPLRVQLLSADGLTQRAGSAITLALLSGTARFSACNSLPCTLVTDATGSITTTVTPTSIGTISLQFSSGSASAPLNVSLSAGAETMQVKSAPSGAQTAGLPTTSPFALKLLAADGLTPIVGEAVVFTSTGSSATFGACGGPVCTLTSDAQGLVQSSVSAASAGAVTVSAVANAGAVTATFNAVAPPDVLHVVSAPSGTVFIGAGSVPIFAVRITAADGITPVTGKPVTFSLSTGAATFASCGQATCVVVTDAHGLASTPVTATAAGATSLLASSEAGSATAAFTASALIRSVTVTRPVQYVAENTAIAWSPAVSLADNSSSVSNVPVSWSGSSGITFSAATLISDANGLSTEKAIAAPLAAGARSVSYACAWVTVCSPVAAEGVGANDWRLVEVSGATQSASVGDTLDPVTLRVVNLAGNPVAGVSVQIQQAVTEWEATCPDSGRCAVPATLISTNSSAVSNPDGLVTITPSQISGVPTITRIAAIAGTQGFATLALERHP